MKLTANRIAGILREHGYRLTPQRHAVLRVIAASHDHLTPAEIHERILETNPGIGLVTVYRVINLLAELKLICRVGIDAAGPRYLMRRPTGHHHHLICSQCGRAVDFTDCDLAPLEKRLSRETGFIIDGHFLEVHGRCPACTAAADNE
jgi:Fur family transcriptional regulator, ferric uptake regulator